MYIKLLNLTSSSRFVCSMRSHLRGTHLELPRLELSGVDLMIVTRKPRNSWVLTFSTPQGGREGSQLSSCLAEPGHADKDAISRCLCSVIEFYIYIYIEGGSTVLPKLPKAIDKIQICLPTFFGIEQVAKAFPSLISACIVGHPNRGIWGMSSFWLQYKGFMGVPFPYTP